MNQIGRRDFLKAGALIGGAALTPLGAHAFAARPAGAGRFSWKKVAPEAAGMSRAGLAGIGAAVQKNIDARLISGAVTALARHGKLVWFEAQGWADAGLGKPMRRDSLFRMMSSSKVVTAVAVLMMLEEGKLALEDPVSRFIPSFRGQKVRVPAPGGSAGVGATYVAAARDITVRDLLTHTSGLSTIEGPGGGIANARRGPHDRLADVIPRLGSVALDHQPGTKWRYSPLDGIDTLLYLVELVSRTPADRFLKERIFQPLDMGSTWFNVPAKEKQRLVRIHAAKNGGFEARPWLFGEGPFSYFSGAGGLTSCAHDMLHFELMLLHRGSFNGRRLLRPATVELMTRNHVGKLFADWIPPITRGNGFGLGVRVLEDESRGGGMAAGAFGWGGAYGTETWADPKLDLAAVFLIQMDPAPREARADFARAVRKAIVA